MFLLLLVSLRGNVSADPVIDAIVALGMRPPPPPLNVTLVYYFKALIKLDSIEQTITVSQIIKMIWKDPRLERILKQHNETSFVQFAAGL